jgi:lysophospholipase L1-like esterase
MNAWIRLRTDWASRWRIPPSRLNSGRYPFSGSLVVLFIFLFVRLGSCVTLNGVDVPKDKLICYIFIGHSNMEGYGGVPDTITNPRVWAYDSVIGFWNARDPVATSYYSPSPFMPFLKKMAELYPDYYFFGVKVTQAGMPMSSQFLPKMPKYAAVMRTIAPIKDSVTVGGIVAMFGWVEGASDSLSQHLDVNINTMLSGFRQDLGIPNLPLIIGRYEENADTTYAPYKNFYTYRSRIISKLEMLQSEDSLQHRIMLTPFLPIPKTMFFDDHHYNADGYTLWSNTGAQILYNSNWNTWYPQKTAPLKMLFPSGGEHFAATDTIPITWMCDPESLSVILIYVSQDSGKTLNLVSGDQALYPWIKTLYWTPSQSGLTFSKNPSLTIEIYDYDGKHHCSSNSFTLDGMPTGVRMSRTLQSGCRFATVRISPTSIDVGMEPREFTRAVSIYSMQGRRLVQRTIERNAVSCSIPSSTLTNGTYILAVSPPAASKSESAARFVIQK